MSSEAMSSERDPLLATPPQHHANAQNLEEAREEKLGPLEISRSSRWAILAGIWMASLLGVRPTTFRSIRPSERSIPPVFEQCVPRPFLWDLLNHLTSSSNPGGNPYVVNLFSACPS